MSTRGGIISQIGEATARIFRNIAGLIEFTGEVTAGIGDALRHPTRIRWRETVTCMNRCGADGMPVVALICLLTGVILAYHASVQMHRFGADVFLPALVGCTMVRELAPLMTAVMVTGRSGSAFAAEIATMKVSEELDALTTMGLSPVRFLVIPKLIAMICMVPLLTVIGDFIGIAGSMGVGVVELNMSCETYLQLTRQWIAPKYVIEGILKSFVFAWLITVSSCWCGFRTGGDSVAVGNATTRSVVTSILLVVIGDALLAKAFSVIYGMGS